MADGASISTTPTAPSFNELMWPALRALKAMGGSASNEELLAKVIELEIFSPEVQAILHSDNRQTKLNYNIAWARTYLKHTGFVENSARGVWSLTKVGEKATQADLLDVLAKVRLKFPKSSREKQNDASDTPILALERNEIAPTWKDDLLTVLRALPSSAFERLSQRLLREAGFVTVEVTGRSGDGGIDGVGVLRLNLLSFRVLFQCKRYQGSVGAGAIRDFRGAMMGRTDKGLVITTGTFTAEAKREATRDGAPAIDLIDGDQFCDLLKQHKLGVGIEMVERTTVNQDWFQDL